MRLYHMTDLKTATDFILPEKRMRLSRFDTLNDPFELMSLRVVGPDARKTLKSVISNFVSKLGVLCMVKHSRSPLMWAHYADNHRGVCLGFDVLPDDVPQKVQYTSERKVHVLDTAHPTGGITEHHLNELLTTKSSGWKYEEEWRLIIKLMEPDPVNGHHYLPFHQNFVLREIIVGLRCKESVESFRRLVGDVGQSVSIIQARPAFETFTIVPQRQVPPIVISPKGKTNP